MPLLPRSSVRRVSGSPTIAKHLRKRKAPPWRLPVKESGGGEAISPQRRRTPKHRRASLPSSENEAQRSCERPVFQVFFGYGGKSAIPGAAQDPPPPAVQDTRSSWPLQQNHLSCKTRPESHKQTVAPRRHLALR